CRGILNETVHIGVVLDNNSWVGKVAETALKIAADDVNNNAQLLNGTRLLLHVRYAHTLLDVAAAAVDLFKREVVAIIGQQTHDVAEIVSTLGDAANVPIVSLLENHKIPYFVGMAGSDVFQMQAIAALVKTYGWKRIIFIDEDNYYGSAAASSLSDALRAFGSEIEYRSAIFPNADKQTIRKNLHKLKIMDTRVFVARVPSDLGVNLFREAHEMGMMEAGYVWITTYEFTNVWDYVLNTSTMASMQGILGVKTHIPNFDQLKDFTDRWKCQFAVDNPDTVTAELNLHGLLAYDAVVMIARAIGNLGTNASLTFLTPQVIGSAQVKIFHQGKKLLQQIVQLRQGQMSEISYEIVNIVDKSYRMVGYWTDKLPGKLSTTLPSNGSEGVRPVIWPGRSTHIPRGWEISTCGKRLKMGVPVKDGWNEMVTVTFDPDLNESIFTGFCIDVFDAVLKELDYPLPYDLVPCADDDGHDKLIHQVYLQRLDGVLGDTTILASRSKTVDFSMPYSDSGLVMVVPIERNDDNIIWAFLKPFSTLVWFTLAIFFAFTGAVVWLLERGTYSDFRGKPHTHAVKTIFWFSFSTLFVTQGHKIQSSLGRMVIIVWLFLVLILTSSYTASLTSTLTIQKMKASIATVEALAASGSPVGYQKGSFVADYLHNNLGISKRNLRAYGTAEEYAEALLKGPNRGGVAAIFDEIPYVRLFLSSRCGFTMVGPIYKTGGFGFVFSKGSPLVADISAVILNLTESMAIPSLEAKYFNKTPNCDNSAADSRNLNLKNISGEFLWAWMFVLIISICALINKFSGTQE
ncbi:hypothetical protein KI387_019181, partial [Taxus chinensis]